MHVTEEDFKLALSKWATGVCVVTASVAGDIHGMAVSSFSSVSLQPPIISVCLAERSYTHALVRSSQLFGVSVLSREQQSVALRFSSPGAKEERFPEGTYDLGPANNPLLRGSLAQLECRVVASHASGDHAILLGEVQYARVSSGDPLLYHARSFGTFTSHA